MTFYNKMREHRCRSCSNWQRLQKTKTHPCLEMEAQMDSVTQGREVHSTHITDEDPEIL